MTEKTKAQEAWLPIDGYDGVYEVSNTGKVRSRSRKYNFVPTEIKLSKNAEGYLSVSLTKDGKGKSYKVHRLVIETFVSRSRMMINHINSIKSDNRVENLEYVSNRENVNHSKVSTRKLPTGVSEKNGRYESMAMFWSF